MPRETNTPAVRNAHRWLSPIDLAHQATIGGKARSLARLAVLGLPVPPAFVVAPALFDALRAGGPPLPNGLRTAADLTALEAAQRALRTAAFPPGFDASLQVALEHMQSAVEPAARNGAFALAVRSSADGEDRPGTLGAGVFASRLQVPPASVAEAIREVLASFLSPAAWAYAAGAAGGVGGRAGAGAGGPQKAIAQRPGGGGAVLIHPFIAGDAWGAVAATPVPTPRLGVRENIDVRIVMTGGRPSERSRDSVAKGARAAAAVHGAVELEWVSSGDAVTFLQMRAYQPGPQPGTPPASTANGAAPAVGAMKFDGGGGTGEGGADAGWSPGAGWTWDAAHNPLPLSPAQAGLVELVDERCHIGMRQRVRRGYLFYRPATPAAGAVPTPSHLGGSFTSEKVPRCGSARNAFDELSAAIEPRLVELGHAPTLEGALDLFVAAYQPLFGVVEPASAAARAALAEFLRRRLPDPATELWRLFGGVESVATQRRAAVREILNAPAGDPDRRQAAIDDYLRRFGDESPRWDVAEPTLRETPQRLLALAAARDETAVPPSTTDETALATDTAALCAHAVRSQLAPTDRAHFDSLLADARDAVAVGEDDDALFARLQATVRRALLAVGRRLVEARELDAEDDVFYLPLSLTRRLVNGGRAEDRGGGGESKLREIAAAGLQAYREAAQAPPAPPRRQGGGGDAGVVSPGRVENTADTAVPAEGRSGPGIVRGATGSGGRVIGRAVHHPAARPLGPEAVLVAATLLPTELPLLAPGALVVETGHVLGHVAAQARERGIPAVVGATGARAMIPEGALLLVDGDRGEIVLLVEPT